MPTQSQPGRLALRGASLQIVRHHYVRGGGGVYRFGWKSHKGVKAKGSLIKT